MTDCGGLHFEFVDAKPSRARRMQIGVLPSYTTSRPGDALVLPGTHKHGSDRFNYQGVLTSLQVLLVV